MSELRKDAITGRWVIISTDRRRRPTHFRLERQTLIGAEYCPFCAGREDMTPPEVLAYRHDGSTPNTAGWELRVVPNKFPALQVEGTLDKRGDGVYDMMNGIGAHEVVIECPHGETNMSRLGVDNIREVLWV